MLLFLTLLIVEFSVVAYILWYFYIFINFKVIDVIFYGFFPQHFLINIRNLTLRTYYSFNITSNICFMECFRRVLTSVYTIER